MFKAVLIRLALNLVLDLLLALATKKYQESEPDSADRRRWFLIIDFLSDLKTIGLNGVSEKKYT